MYKTAAILSFFIPGLGQIIKGDKSKGYLLLIAWLPAYVAFIIPGLLLTAYAVYDAAKTPAPTPKPKAEPKADAKPSAFTPIVKGGLIFVGGFFALLVFIIANDPGPTDAELAADAAASAEYDMKVAARNVCQYRATQMAHHPRSVDFNWTMDFYQAQPSQADLNDESSEKTTLVQIHQGFTALNGYGNEIPGTMYCVVEHIPSTDNFTFHRIDFGQ